MNCNHPSAVHLHWDLSYKYSAVLHRLVLLLDTTNLVNQMAEGNVSKRGDGGLGFGQRIHALELEIVRDGDGLGMFVCLCGAFRRGCKCVESALASPMASAAQATFCRPVPCCLPAFQGGFCKPLFFVPLCPPQAICGQFPLETNSLTVAILDLLRCARSMHCSKWHLLGLTDASFWTFKISEPEITTVILLT